MPLLDTDLVRKVISSQDFNSVRNREAALLLSIATEVARGLASRPFNGKPDEIGDESFKIAATILYRARSWANEEPGNPPQETKPKERFYNKAAHTAESVSDQVLTP